MPPLAVELPVRSPSAWNEARTERLLVRFTVTHSPAATCSTSGSGRYLPAMASAAFTVGTKAARMLLLPKRLLGRSTADTLNTRVGTRAGHGFDAVPLATGGRPPVLLGTLQAFAGTLPLSVSR